MKNIFTKSEFKNLILVIMGNLALALGVVLFFLSNSITTGGTPGMALLIHHLSGLSMGSIVMLINIPLLLFSLKYLGKLFVARTVVSIILLSIFIDLFTQVLSINAITNDILLASIFGGALIGLGVGLILSGNSSAGGSTIIARIVASKTEIKPGQVILFIDFTIILCSIYIFNDIDKALWSILSIYITSKSIDIILSGNPRAKVVHISTNKATQISSLIYEQLGKEGTILKGDRFSKLKEREIIFVVVELRNLRKLRAIIQDCDEDALMIVIEASEMLGREYK